MSAIIFVKCSSVDQYSSGGKAIEHMSSSFHIFCAFTALLVAVIARDCNYPACTVCRDGRTPKRINTIVTVMNVADNVSCRRLDRMARDGCVPESWCRPMQNHFVNVCECPTGDDDSSDGSPIGEVTVEWISGDSDSEESGSGGSWYDGDSGGSTGNGSGGGDNGGVGGDDSENSADDGAYSNGGGCGGGNNEVAGDVVFIDDCGGRDSEDGGGFFGPWWPTSNEKSDAQSFLPHPWLWVVILVAVSF